MKRIAIAVALSSLFAAQAFAASPLDTSPEFDFLPAKSTYEEKHANDPVTIRDTALPAVVLEDGDYLPAQRTYMDKRGDSGATGSVFPAASSKDNDD